MELYHDACYTSPRRSVEIFLRTPNAGLMEAACTSETSVDIDLRTRQYIPEDYELYTHRYENLKSHITLLLLV
jgi:hypothetical protein